MTAGLGSSWFIGPFPHIAQRLPGGPFGSPSAIAPHFEAMEPAEQVSAIRLMQERGDDLREIGDWLGLSPHALAAMGDRRCPLISPRGEGDDTRCRPSAGPKRRAVSSAAVDRALDATLMAIDALRARAGGARQAEFDLTLEEVCQACGFGLETARRRFRELESRKWIRRTLRPGQPARVMIALAGRCRLEALADGKGRAEP
ncbi:hypothetical protein [Hoeflea sp. EC-HK425]|uniref:hypothetical protein n=1 Tax=Hoeflea sp. EC-HK425 TaxID=2038388 RepID=UPI0012591B1A|nr:hypothetical protein [Hoeflea sp. EC-HK425]VVT15276.1 conserved hypothetical protein [Hoeflea sp. EC-HK425]